MFLGEHLPNLHLKSPDKPHDKIILHPSPNTPQNPNLLMANNLVGHSQHATTSTQSSNFYENTMHSDTSSVKKRKSVISSQSTGSSNEVIMTIVNIKRERLIDLFLGPNFIYTATSKAFATPQFQKLKYNFSDVRIDSYNRVSLNGQWQKASSSKR